MCGKWLVIVGVFFIVCELSLRSRNDGYLINDGICILINRTSASSSCRTNSTHIDDEPNTMDFRLLSIGASNAMTTVRYEIFK